VDTRNVNDFQAWLSLLRESGELIATDKSVDPDRELGAISRTALRRGYPALLYQKVARSPIPVAVNTMATRRRLALLIGAREESLILDYLDKCSRSRYCSPVIQDDGACKEEKAFGRDVDLSVYPQTVWNDGDGGVYFTLGVVRIKNPENGKGNISVNRLQVKDRNHIAINTGRERGLGRAIWKAWDKNEPAQVVITFGGDPLYTLAAIESLGPDQDEFELAGALKGGPLQAVYGDICKHIEIPAHSEIVMEGLIRPNMLVPEGPFGEVNGYYCAQDTAPLMEVQAITMRRDPVMPATYAGIPPSETTVIQDFLIEAALTRALSKSGVDVRKIHIPPGSGGYHAIIAIRKNSEGDVRKVTRFAVAVLSLKFIVITDDDVDVSRQEELYWALSTRFSSEKDLHIINNMPAVNIDNTAALNDGKRTVTKMVLDATRKHDGSGASVRERRNERIDQYLSYLEGILNVDGELRTM